MKHSISQNEIENSYKKLLEDVRTKDFYKIDLTNRVNCYVCKSCGHVTKTKDVDAGVTPASFSCEICNALAWSTFYKDILPNKLPTFEWYRPTLEELFKIRKKKAFSIEHVLKGGLEYRKVKLP